MMGIAMFGHQRVLSLGMAYGIDCDKPQAPYVAEGLIFCRQLFGFIVNYWVPMGRKSGELIYVA